MNEATPSDAITSGRAPEGIDLNDAGAIAAALVSANRTYYDGAPTMDDAVYDRLRRRLRKLDPDNPLLATVGAPTDPASGLQKVRHHIPMGSLSNTADEDEITAFFARTARLSEKAGAATPLVYIAQPKMDGFSVELVFNTGRLVQAVTRGDGVEGEDITHNLYRAKGVPRSLPEPLDIAVRGEVVVHREDFRLHFKGDANPRNSAAGTARRLDGHRAHHLQFYAFDAVHLADGSPLDATERKAVDRLTALGFRSVEYAILRGESSDEALKAALDHWRLMKVRRVELPFDIDGCVLKVNNIAKSRALGVVDQCPRGQCAMKWAGSMVAQTVVIGHEASVGRTGAITPVVILRPVECGGVTVSRASLCNWDEVKRLGVGQGAKVTLERAGEVIPKVTEVLERPEGFAVFARPTHCPKCSAETVEDGPRQLCPNTDCPARTYRAVTHWVKQRNILHLGDETVDRLMALDGPVQNIDDLYRIGLVELTAAAGGAVMARKVLASLEKSKDCPLVELIGSVGVPGMGHAEAAKLAKALSLTDVDGFLVLGVPDIEGVHGFGPEKAAKMVRGFALRANLLRRLNSLLTVRAPETGGRRGALAGKKVCATGPSEIPREQLIKLMVDAGAEWHSSVVNGLDYLVQADANSQSVKTKAARAKGVTIISESDMLVLIGYGKG